MVSKLRMSGEQFERERERLQDARWAITIELRNLAAHQCPGVHAPIQHRVGEPRWCPACGRDAEGVRRDGAKVALSPSSPVPGTPGEREEGADRG